MKYGNLENEIVNQLMRDTQLVQVSDVMALPDSLEYYRTPFAKGLVTVIFAGEKYDKNQSISEASQHFTALFNVSVQARLLRGDRGVYAIADKVKDGLEGFRLTDGGPLTLQEHEFIGYQNDVWEHAITFTCRSLRVQKIKNDLPGYNVTGADEEIFYSPPNLTINEEVQV